MPLFLYINCEVFTLDLNKMRPHATMKRGINNTITDVPGVRVGHFTRTDGSHQTGVTVVIPCENPFFEKPVCASFVLNGFGKSLGLVQIDELGTLETPIALTNTLNVGKIHDALVSYMISECAKHNFSLRSVNPVVLECNDGGLNFIQERVLGEKELMEAFSSAATDFEQGAVGAGRGMVCHGFKGGIGSASRIMEIDGKTYTFGALALANHGRMADLILDGKTPFAEDQREACDKGSCIFIFATDLPLSHRQLTRVIRRGSVGLARLGSFIGHGSGEVFVGFTTANRMPHEAEENLVSFTVLRESKMDIPFRACAEAAEEAVFNALYYAQSVTGHEGLTVSSLSERINTTKS